MAGTNLLQRGTPDAIRGCVFGAIGAAGLVMNVPAFLIGGVLVGVIAGRGVYLVGGLSSGGGGQAVTRPASGPPAARRRW